MSNRIETYKSPYSLLNLKPGQFNSVDWSEILRKKRKEVLAEFNLHNAPALTIDGQSWTRSEVLSGFEELAREPQTFHGLIWELGWIDFWRGKGDIPANMANQISWQGQYEQELYEGFENLLSGRLHEFIRRHQYSSILEVVTFSFAVPAEILKKAESPIYNLLLNETLKWRGRIFDIRPEGVEKGYLEWFPVKYAELVSMLPKRYEEEGSQWAKAVLDTSVFLARYLTIKKRKEILTPIHTSNKYWPKDLCVRWDTMQQSLLIVPQSASIVQKSISSKKIILQVIFITLSCGLAGYFTAYLSSPSVVHKKFPLENSQLQYFPTDSIFSPGFQYDTFELKPYHSGKVEESLPGESPYPTFQSTP